jgi:hypothetical protein
MRQIGIVLLTYADDNNEYGPSDPPTTYSPTAASPNNGWLPELWPLQCAAYFNLPASVTTVDAAGDAAKVLQCPSTYVKNAKRSYGMNCLFGGKPNSAQWQWDQGAHPMPLRHPFIQRYSDSYCMAAESIGYNWLIPRWGHGSAYEGWRTLWPRLHARKRHYLLADGHGEATEPNGKRFLFGKYSTMAGGGEMWTRNNHGGQGEWPVTGYP